jgi:SAM-dependent methyltransferase
VGSRVELVQLFLKEQRDPEPFHERLADDAMSTIPARLAGTTVIDLGCGPGHYTRALRRQGAFVVPIDLDSEEFTLPGGPPGNEVVASGMNLPVRSEAADGLLCSNMIEHTPDPARVVAEMCRVVRPGGWVWLSWTNWYSPWGGHDMSPYHYLGPERGLRVYRRLKHHDPKNCPGRTLFPLHIGPMLRLLQSAPGVRVLRAVPRYYPSQRWILAVPGVREVLAWNCLVVLERTATP